MSEPRLYFRPGTVGVVDAYWRGNQVGTIVLRGQAFFWRSFLEHDGRVGGFEADLNSAKNKLSEHVRLWSASRSQSADGLTPMCGEIA